MVFRGLVCYCYTNITAENCQQNYGPWPLWRQCPTLARQATCQRFLTLSGCLSIATYLPICSSISRCIYRSIYIFYIYLFNLSFESLQNQMHRSNPHQTAKQSQPVPRALSGLCMSRLNSLQEKRKPRILFLVLPPANKSCQYHPF